MKTKKLIFLFGISMTAMTLSGCILDRPVRIDKLPTETVLPTNNEITTETNTPAPEENVKIAVSNGEFTEWPKWAVELGFSHPVGLILDKEQSAISAYNGELVDSVTAVYTGTMKAKISAAEKFIKDLATLGVAEVSYSPRKNGLVGILADNSKQADRTYSISIMANESILQVKVFNLKQQN
jgi:hypothetical protein